MMEFEDILEQIRQRESELACSGLEAVLFKIGDLNCAIRRTPKGLRYLYRTFTPNELPSASQLAMIAFQSQRARWKA